MLAIVVTCFTLGGCVCFVLFCFAFVFVSYCFVVVVVCLFTGVVACLLGLRNVYWLSFFWGWVVL